MLRTFVAETPAQMDRFRGLWDELCRRGRYTLFQSFAWNQLAARAFSKRESPRVVGVENGSGAAIVPACVTDQGTSLLGDVLFDYRDLLASGVGSASTHAWKELARTHVPFTITALRGEARLRWEELGVPIEPFVGAPCVLLSDTDAASFEARHHRSSRLLRRLARLGVAPRQHSGTNSALVRRIYALKGEQPVESGENLLGDRLRREFLVAAAASTPCDIFTRESAGTLVAALVTFRDGTTRRFYTTYYDPAWARYSPGIALLFEATRRSLREGLDCDYMTGEQPHKLRFATSAVPLYRVQATAGVLAYIAAGGRALAA